MNGWRKPIGWSSRTGGNALGAVVGASALLLAAGLTYIEASELKGTGVWIGPVGVGVDPWLSTGSPLAEHNPLTVTYNDGSCETYQQYRFAWFVLTRHWNAPRREVEGYENGPAHDL